MGNNSEFPKDLHYKIYNKSLKILNPKIENQSIEYCYFIQSENLLLVGGKLKEKEDSKIYALCLLSGEIKSTFLYYLIN